MMKYSIPELLDSGRWTLDSGCWTLDSARLTLTSGLCGRADSSRLNPGVRGKHLTSQLSLVTA